MRVESRRLHGERGGAFSAELRPEQILSPTAGTPLPEWRRALDTKLRSIRILRITACAVHKTSLLLRLSRSKKHRSHLRCLCRCGTWISAVRLARVQHLAKMRNNLPGKELELPLCLI